MDVRNSGNSTSGPTSGSTSPGSASAADTGVPAPGDRVAVVGGIVCDNLAAPTRILAAQRSYPPELAGQWEFPGGKVEPGEEPREALRRELREELGVTVQLGEAEPGPEDGGWVTSGPYVMTVYWCTADTPPGAGASHSRVRWVTADNALDLPWLAGNRPVVEAVVRRLR